MRNIKISVLFTVLLSSAGNCMSQVISMVTQKFDTFRQHQVQEKIYLHTDKAFYLAGEIAWFKIYMVDGAFHKPLALSKVVYVELLDNANRPVVQAKVGLTEGMGNGSLYMPVVLNSGNYKLRAYSSWMKNFSADYFFEKIITIVNSQKAYEAPIQDIKMEYDIQFFPEGGNLVQNLSSNVGFKAVDKYGRGIDCQVAVFSDNGDTVARFTPLKFGIASFSFTPLPAHQYKALVKPLHAAAIIKELPLVYPEGYVMSVSNAGNNMVQINVQCNIPLVNDLYLFAHTRQSVKAVEAGQVKNGTTQFLVDKNKLGDGISHFTIFNSSRQPLCERLYFKYPAQKLEISLTSDQRSYAERKRINVSVSAAVQGKPNVVSDLSMAVYRTDSLQLLDESSISSYIWLVSDLKGSIESPGYYFNNPETVTSKAMDNLMLTQGWRRFSWARVLNDTGFYFAYPPEYKGHIVLGKIIDNRTGAPAKDITGYLSVPNTRSHFSPVLSDDSGRVNFELRNMYGSSEIVVQTEPRDSMYRVELANPFSERYAATALPQYLLKENRLGSLLDQSIGMQVQNIYVGEKMQQFYKNEDTSAFYRNADMKYLLDDYVRFTTMEEVLREYVILANVRKRQGGYHLNLYDEPGKRVFENDPLVLLDGIPVFDINKLISYDALKIRKLEVLTGKYFLGSSNYDGILNYSAYKGDYNGFEMDPHAIILDYEGLQLQRQFYAPVYENMKQVASHLPDFRNVLYWEPDLVTNKEGSKQVNFYTSDIPGKYAVIVEGITKEGVSGTGMTMFEVKE